MATKMQALAVAKKYGFALDAVVALATFFGTLAAFFGTLAALVVPFAIGWLK